MNHATFTLSDSDAIKGISARIPGWSDAKQYLFFKSLLASHPGMKRLLMLGVYHGRDIAFILSILARYHPGRVMEIVGVDKFNAEPCADWPEEKRGMTWEQAFGCAPPDVAKATDNTRSPFVTLLKRDESMLLDKTILGQFDAIYYDTDHTYETVKRQLKESSWYAQKETILCGDDYSDSGTWGVKRAVTEAFTSHDVFHNWIWFAPASNLKVTA